MTDIRRRSAVAPRAVLVALLAAAVPVGALGAGIPVVAAGEKPHMFLASMKGMVRVARAGTDEWRKPVPPEPLNPGDRVSVIVGRAQLEFDDGSVVVLSSRTTLEIKDMNSGKVAGSRKVVLSLARGLIRAIVHRLNPDDAFEVSSQYALAAVKGTDFAFDGRGVTVLSDREDGGRHQVQLSDPESRTSVLVSENMTAAVRNDGTLETPHAADPRRLDELRQALEPARPSPASGVTPAVPGGGNVNAASPRAATPASPANQGGGAAPASGVTPAVPGGGNEHAESDHAATPASPADERAAADEPAGTPAEPPAADAVDRAIITGDQAPTPPPAPVEDTCGCGCTGGSAKCK